MPKTPKDDGTVLRHVKYKQKLSGKLPVPGIINLQVVGTGGEGTPKSVIVFTEHFRYLFNCGEGCQRIITENKMKPSRLEQIFITHKSWANTGGLLGMALTLQSVKVPKITIHGPPSVEKGVTMCKTFADLSLNNMQICKNEMENGSYVDNAMTIDYIPIYSNSIVTDTSEAESVAKRRRLSQDQYGVSVAYICKPHPAARKLDLEKCLDLGVPRTPLLGKLKDGHEITLPNGTVVKPDQVLSEQLPSRPFLFIEVPDVNYLDSLINNVKITRLQEEQEQSDGLELVVHMSPEGVVNHPTYQLWLKKFPSFTRHLMLTGSGESVVSQGIYRLQAKLNLLSDRIFPLLPHQIGDQVRCLKPDSEDSSVIPGYTNLVYHLRPNKQLDCESCISLNNKEFCNEVQSQAGFEEKFQELKRKVQESEKGAERINPYPRVVFLGTGSSVPSKDRNVSAIMLHLSDEKCLLLDCGEGTLGQIYRHYGRQTPTILRQLQAIYVSHMHADHHIGIFSVLYERQKILGSDVEPLPILAPSNYRRWLNDYLTQICSEYPVRCEVLSIHYLLPDAKDKNQELYDRVLDLLSLQQFAVVFVRHCKNSFGLSLTHKDGWKITYSGDTMPCNDLVTIGENSDILIHEATMEDGLEEEAAVKTHSTISQAIDIGVKMNAKFILLNHFSQRYAKIPVFSDVFSDRIGISFDNMEVTLDDLKILPHFNDPLKLMFSEHYAEMEEKIEKRKIKQKALDMLVEEKQKLEKTS